MSSVASLMIWGWWLVGMVWVWVGMSLGVLMAMVMSWRRWLLGVVMWVGSRVLGGFG